MISLLSEIKLTMLAWIPVPPKGSLPTSGTLMLMSDGATFWLGTVDTYLTDGPPANFRPTYWAKLNNLSEILCKR